MDFAKKLMTKYGWTEGKGLGKTESGICKPIKASLKFDNAGIGHKHGDESDRWWEKLYNDVADNVKIKKSTESNELVIKLKNKELLTEIKTKKRSKKKKDGDPEYGTFIKRSVLTQTQTVAVDGEESSDEEPGLVKLNVLSDEDLFAACGGRTAHKGARHGLNLKGKLSRIEEQERKFLEMQNVAGQTDSTDKLLEQSSASSWESYTSSVTNDSTTNDSTSLDRKIKCPTCRKKKCKCDNVFEETHVSRKRKLLDSADESLENKKDMDRREGVREPQSNVSKSPSSKNAENKRRRMGVSSPSEPPTNRETIKKVKLKQLRKSVENDVQ